jgi:hypothetical protein
VPVTGDEGVGREEREFSSLRRDDVTMVQSVRVGGRIEPCFPLQGVSRLADRLAYPSRVRGASDPHGLPRERNGALLGALAASVLEKCLTPPTLSERRCYASQPETLVMCRDWPTFWME